MSGYTLQIFTSEHAIDDATCRRVQAAMDAGVPEPTEIIEGEMAMADDVRRASHIEVAQAVFELVDAYLDAQRDALGEFFNLTLDGREGVAQPPR